MNEYNGDPRFKPISMWGYFGYQILFALPVVGFIFLIIFAISNGNINRRNFARSYFCVLIIVVIILIIVFAAAGATGSIGSLIDSLTNN